MMKKSFVLLMAAGLILTGYNISAAGVVGTEHDLTGGSGDVCASCHIPHNAQADSIWFDDLTDNATALPGYTVLAQMCYSCHDGNVATTGADTVFNTVLQQHITTGGSDCNACHNPHDNTNGLFVNISATQGAGTESATYCNTCHDSTDAGSLGDHLAGSEHPYTDSGTDLDDSCNSCHQMHGAVDYTVGTLTNPILKVDNTDSGYCDDCHGSYVEDGGSGYKHPANVTTSSGSWSKVNCESCHDPHQPTTSNPFILNDANNDSAYCETCHDATNETDGPKIGGTSHPTGIALSMTPTNSTVAPVGNAIDDDDADGADYGGATAVLVCETCHSAHQKGVESPLLRITTNSSAANSLCLNCHDY